MSSAWAAARPLTVEVPADDGNDHRQRDQTDNADHKTRNQSRYLRPVDRWPVPTPEDSAFDGSAGTGSLPVAVA